jgi:hypothetical protein
VLSHIDLVTTATDQGGYSQVVVIHDPLSAANPQLAELLSSQLSTTRGSGQVTKHANGDLSVVNNLGIELITAPAPTMWDSTGGVTPPPGDGRAESGSDGPGAGAKVESVRTQVAAGHVALAPEGAMLTSADTVWPVYLRLAWNPTNNVNAIPYDGWTSIDNHYHGQAFYNTDVDAAVGLNDWSRRPSVTRPFFQFPLTTTEDMHILNATLHTTQLWSATGDGTWVDLYRTCRIDSTTTWDNQGCLGAHITRGYVPGNWRDDGSDQPRAQDFDVTNEIMAATRERRNIETITIRAVDEANTNAWRRFANNPTLAVTYSLPPTVPQDPGTSPYTPCGPGSHTPPYGTINNYPVTLFAEISNPSGLDQPLYVEFVVVDESTSSIVATPSTTIETHLAIASVTLPAPTFSGGHTYGWQVRAFDGRDYSQYSPTCHFIFTGRSARSPHVRIAPHPTGTIPPPRRKPTGQARL